MRVTSAAVAVAFLLAAPGVAAAHHGHGSHGHRGNGVKRIVVIYQENHSFDNLYGGWEGVNGVANADAAHTTQVNQAGTPYMCLKQDDVNLTSPPLSATCHDATVTPAFDGAFPNAPFRIDDFIAATDTTCPPPGGSSMPNGFLKGTGLPGGCTRDLVHRFYQEQYQLHGGEQNRYVTGSDAIGLTMGTYGTTALPIYEYLHAPGHPRYAIADDFFQAAFGGSFLNHQWLVAAATPTFPGATADQHSVLDSNGMPTRYPLYTPTGEVRDTALTSACPAPSGLACGDFAVNTIQPTFQPFQPGTSDASRLPPQTVPTIGDRLSAKGIDWAWYSGGWSNANGDIGAPGWTNGNGPTCSDPNTAAGATFPNCPDKLFQYHHQPLNYFASFAPGTAMRRDHLRDEDAFLALARSSKKRCELKPVSFIKPIGEDNEHPGYASESIGSGHLVELLQAIENSRCRKDTMVIATYDEFGGQWDHVTPPGLGGKSGPHDKWGPGTRIPALVISPGLHGNFVVDHTQYDTTSILATIEQRFGLQPLTSRDAEVSSMFDVLSAKPSRPNAFPHHGPWARRRH